MTRLIYGLEKYLAKEFVETRPVIINKITEGKKVTESIVGLFPIIRKGNDKRLAIDSPNDARNYLRNPKTGGYTRKACEALLKLKTNNINKIFNKEDVKRVQSCMTLFALTTKCELFNKVLDRYFFGKYDGYTIRALKAMKKEEDKIRSIRPL